MPINVLPKDSPRGRGPEPIQSSNWKPQEQIDGEEAKLKESDLAAQETQALWESEEIGITNWSDQGSQRYSDPGAD